MKSVTATEEARILSIDNGKQWVGGKKVDGGHFEADPSTRSVRLGFDDFEKIEMQVPTPHMQGVLVGDRIELTYELERANQFKGNYVNRVYYPTIISAKKVSVAPTKA